MSTEANTSYPLVRTTETGQLKQLDWDSIPVGENKTYQIIIEAQKWFLSTYQATDSKAALGGYFVNILMDRVTTTPGDIPSDHKQFFIQLMDSTVGKTPEPCFANCGQATAQEINQKASDPSVISISATK